MNKELYGSSEMDWQTILEINQKIENIQEDLIEAIGKLVAIDSVQSDPQPNAPFGTGPALALKTALTISESLGFKTVNLDNKIGYAEWGQSNGIDDDQYIGIFGHIDVVASGEGWSSDPFTLRREGDYLFGRGVLDNKSPILSNLFALYILKEMGVAFKRPIRIVFGTNEESGFECVAHYNQVAKPPIFGWTPDCKWPVVIGEKGRMNIRLVNHGDTSNFFKYINDFIFSSITDGKSLGISHSDKLFGDNLMRNYRLEYKDGQEALRWSISYPGSLATDSILEKIKTTLPDRIELEVISQADPILYYDKNSPFVEKIATVYRSFIDVDEAIVATSGGTYARAIPNIIAYGPSFPDQKNIAHLPDEWVKITDLMLNTKIYAQALYAIREM